MSKRLPGKNTKLFHGKPVIEYTIQAAKNSGCFNEILVSTDDNDIGKLASDLGVTAFYRDAATCQDDSPMVEAVVETLQTNPASYVCMAYACAPFINGQRIREAFKYLLSGDYDSVFPVYRAEAPERVLIRRGDWFISRYPEYDNVNSQRFPYSYHSAGQFYFCDAAMVEWHETVMLPRCWGIEIPKSEAIDIDTADDWQRAEMMWEANGNQRVRGENVSWRQGTKDR